MWGDKKFYNERRDLVLEQVKEYAKGVEDKTLSLSDLLYVADNGFQKAFLVNTDGIIEKTWLPQAFSPHAESQLLARLNIPASYIHRCPELLKTQNINHWLYYYANRTVVLRCHNGIARATVSTRFSNSLDDIHLFPVVFEGLDELYPCVNNGGDTPDDIHLISFTKSEEVTVLNLAFLDLKVELDGVIAYAGATIVNSETGWSSVWIRPSIRGIFDNATAKYNFLDRASEGTWSVRHTGDLTSSNIKKALSEARDVAQTGLHRLLQTSHEIVSNPVEEVKVIVKNCNFLTQRVLDVLEEEYKDIQETNRLKLARSILDAVKPLPLFKRQLAELEVGRYLNLFDNSKSRLVEVVKDIEAAEQLEE
jgi:hypothetical protein